jgi:hypothetical protein
LQSSSYSNLLFRLAHAGEGAKWVQGSILWNFISAEKLSGKNTPRSDLHL